MSAATPPAGATSPFKFLDAYGAQDSQVFFGRDEEIETLYRLLTESRLVMVYGQSGTGKTSLIQCGLTHKFSPTNWLPVNVRRGDNINTALMTALNGLAITPLAADATVLQAIHSIYLDHLRPLFLIFDQFEELYVLGKSPEQEQFYATFRAVLDHDVSCRIIVSLREEYLAALDPFERAVPSLFDKRLRVEVMTNSNVEKVIVGTCAANGIVLEHGVDTAHLIIAQLDDKRVGVQLAYLQVYLDHLYRMVVGGSGPITFTDAAIAEAGKLGDVMAGFLDEQEKAIETQLAGKVPSGGIARLLEEFVSVDGTKQPSTYAEVLGRIPSAEPWLQSALDLLQNSRLLRRVDDHYELAHDALAARIADRRSAESKQLLMVEKLVQNRISEFGQTRTRLNPEELALVNQASKLKDPLDGSPLLRLGDDATKFVRQSRLANLKQRFGRIGLLFLALLIPSLLLLWNFAQSQEADDRTARESNIADVLAFGTYHNLAYSEDANVKQQIGWAHGLARFANISRELGEDVVRSDAFTEAQAKESFWGRLYDADVLVVGAAPDKGIAEYRKLEEERREEFKVNPDDVLVVGKYKAVLWHHYFSTMPRDPALARELFQLMDSQMTPERGDPIGFYGDLQDLCSQEETTRTLGTKCDRWRGNDTASPSPEPSVPEDSQTNAPKIGYDTNRDPKN